MANEIMPALGPTGRPWPRQSAGPSPLRQPGSLRRTSSIHVSFPQGEHGDLLLLGRARDVRTPASGGPPNLLAQDQFTALMHRDRIIAALDAEPARPRLAALVGQSGSAGFRKRLNQAVPEERASATPLYLLLDDIPGASLVSDWSWSQWDADWLKKTWDAPPGSDLSEKILKRLGVCIANTPGSLALEPSVAAHLVEDALAPDLRHPDDPQGWHEFPAETGVNFRRARRIDITLDDMIRVDSAFQDSASMPDGNRMAVHEYRLFITADPKSLLLRSIHAEPKVLPYRVCPSAIDGLDRLIGLPLPELRDKVLAELRGAVGCTHLNDAMRALAEVPALVTRMAQA